MNDKITIPKPDWDSDIPNIILQLEQLRHNPLSGSTPPHIFSQIKDIFQMVETLASARIEGNNTTISEAVASHLGETPKSNEKAQEITNLNHAMNFIREQHYDGAKISKAYIFELHKLVTQGLSSPAKQGEGSKYIGQLRQHDVKILKSKHEPPSHIILPDRFDEFIDFINQDYDTKNQLLMIAVAHHRFMYIHPFDNGNGRVGRLLNYSLLMKLGYESNTSLNIFNPSALFFASREEYYTQLSVADNLTDQGVLLWCDYFLKGLLHDLQSIQTILDKNNIIKFLDKAIRRAHIFQDITPSQGVVLLELINKDNMTIKSSELDQFGYHTSQQKSYFIKKLRDKKLLKPLSEKGRIYTIDLYNSRLLISAVRILQEQGLIHESLDRL